MNTFLGLFRSEKKMTKQYECPICHEKLKDETTDEVIEKIKEHGKEVHDIEEMSEEELNERKENIEDV
jgi:predicted small metal-binding protein